ncbi:hypothetical protein C427_0883 [Paraglaciecola psychrophila 170]|jgi:hypothetical protein|uniref:Uncharacterized protein n=1 Tax=Paraglaciecola psychrophila 170 TaxID=1129794 RepID=K7AEF0_9ALTE|nr:hypothetical protein C427_0883 [Paraglaciecola psychrophila 170]GAC39023.1 hypothetical protein GPSY_3412 [Paraglaciecola psychrophila 170]
MLLILQMKKLLIHQTFWFGKILSVTAYKDGHLNAILV